MPACNLDVLAVHDCCQPRRFWRSDCACWCHAVVATVYDRRAPTREHASRMQLTWHVARERYGKFIGIVRAMLPEENDGLHGYGAYGDGETFAAHRQHEGGPEDPLFFSTDTKAFAARKPSDFALLHVRPRPGGQGYPVSALGEWRTGSGDALHVHHYEQLHHPGQVHEAANYRGSFPCRDCGWDTNSAAPGVRTENYVVHDKVWQQAGMEKMGGDLCVGCLEKRLGRQLNKHDFPAVPVNDLSDADTEKAYTWRTDRLKNRMQHEAAQAETFD
jgi:hypothetical protein